MFPKIIIRGKIGIIVQFGTQYWVKMMQTLFPKILIRGKIGIIAEFEALYGGDNGVNYVCQDYLPCQYWHHGKLWCSTFKCQVVPISMTQINVFCVQTKDAVKQKRCWQFSPPTWHSRNDKASGDVIWSEVAYVWTLWATRWLKKPITRFTLLNHPLNCSISYFTFN